MISRRMILASIATNLLLVGCSIPTEAPIIEQRWILPVEETTLSVDELLPANVTVSGTNFDLTVDPVSAGQSLGTLCSACVALDGLSFQVPLPAFTGAFTSSQSLPANVLAAEMSSGSIGIRISNGLSFDPLLGGGTITIELRNGSGGALLGQLVLDGATDALPGGGVVLRTLTLTAATIDSPLVTTTSVVTVGGQMVFMDTSQRIDVLATVNSILVSSATVDVPNQVVTIDPVTLDVDDLKSGITDRIVQGSIILDIENPFDVSVVADIDIGPTTKSFSISGSGMSTVVIPYTGDELRSFLGQPGVTFSGSGLANGTSVTVVPGQEVAIKAKLDFTIEIG